MIGRAPILVGALLVAGCAETSVRVETRPPEPAGTVVGEPLDDSTRYGVLLRPDGSDLAVEVRAHELCPASVELRSPRVKVEQRRGASVSYGIGAVLAGLGAGFVVDGLAEDRPPQGQRDVIGRGALLAIAGGVTMVVTRSRARTVVTDIEPLVEHAPGPLVECRLRPAIGVRVSLRTVGGLRETRTDEGGRASFEALATEVPREVFVEDRPATFLIAP